MLKKHIKNASPYQVLLFPVAYTVLSIRQNLTKKLWASRLPQVVLLYHTQPSKLTFIHIKSVSTFWTNFGLFFNCVFPRIFHSNKSSVQKITSVLIYILVNLGSSLSTKKQNPSSSRNCSLLNRKSLPGHPLESSQLLKRVVVRPGNLVWLVPYLFSFVIQGVWWKWASIARPHSRYVFLSNFFFIKIAYTQRFMPLIFHSNLLL